MTRRGRDELCFLDISASHEGRGTLLEVVRRTAEVCFMPLTVGGGVRTLEDIRALLLAGADKVSINTAAVTRPEFVREAAEKFGSQCIVAAIDAKMASSGKYEIFTHGGRKATGIDAIAHSGQAGRLRCGRNSADLDGPGRHAGGLRSAAHPRHRRCGAGAGDRLRRRWQGRRSGDRSSRKVMPARCWPPPSFISAKSASARPSKPWPMRIFRCGRFRVTHRIAQIEPFEFRSA